MNKVYCNKGTDIVEQILKVETIEELADDYFPNCYAIIDEEENVNAYNLKYNKETNEFEVIEGVPERDEVVVEKAPSTEELKKENERLENKIMAMQLALDEIILNLI